MENLLVSALFVSFIGMLLLFVALALLYGLMYCLTSALRDPAPRQAPSKVEQEVETAAPDLMLQAAAVAVALARAGQEPGPSGAAPPAKAGTLGPDSRWWTLHQNRQLTRKPRIQRNR